MAFCSVRKKVLQTMEGTHDKDTETSLDLPPLARSVTIGVITLFSIVMDLRLVKNSRLQKFLILTTQTLFIKREGTYYMSSESLVKL
jgi:hypothetical protein